MTADNTDIPIPADDRERIEQMVRQYRHSIENLYRMAWLQGSIEQVEIDRDALKRKVAA